MTSTERAEADARLREAEERYRSLFQEAPVGVVVVDFATTRVLDANEAACRILGYTDAEVTGRPLFATDSREPCKLFRPHLANVLRHGRGEFEMPYRGPDGWVRALLVSGCVLARGTPARLQFVLQDMTEWKRMERNSGA